MTAGRARGWVGVLAAGLLGAALLRLPGLGTELWMDEILSLRLVETLDSPLGVFTSVHSDNNHYLNSLWLWAIGSGSPAWLLRLPPLLLGAALVALAYRVSLPGGRTTAAVTGALFAFSYPLIHYSSEARGYGYLVLLVLLAYAAYRRWTTEGDWRAGAVYSVVSALAFLAHIGFVTVFAAFLLWSFLEATAVAGNRLRGIGRHVAVHVLPAVILVVLYFVDIRLMQAEGGFARIGPVESLAGAAGLVVGVAPGAVALIIAACAWVAIAIGIRRSASESPAETLFVVTAIGLSLVSGAITGYGYPRYYLTALLFALLFLGRSIGAALASGTWRVPAALLLVMVCAVNLSQTLQFAAVGRGMYREAAAYMVAGRPPGPLTVAGSHDMGTVLALEHYATELPGEPTFLYFCRLESTDGCTRVRPSRSLGEEAPEYFVLASIDDRFVSPHSLDVPDLGTYRFVRTFPKYGLSGVTWALYGYEGRPGLP